MKTKSSYPIIVTACVIGMILIESGVVLSQPPKSDKALSVAPTDSASLDKLLPDVPVSKRISDDDFQEAVRNTLKAFRYKPANEKDWAETITMAFSEDGRFLCVGENNSEWKGVGGFGNGYTGVVKELAVSRLWDLQTGQEVRRFAGHKDEQYIQSVSFCRDARFVSTTAFQPYDERIGIIRVPSGEDVRLWDTKTGEQLYHWDNAGVKSALSPDGTIVAVIGTDHLSVFATSGRSESAVWRTSLETDLNATPAFAQGGKTILVSTYGGLTELDTVTGKVLRVIGGKDHSYTVSKFVLSPTGQILATATQNSVIVWDFEKGVEIRRLSMLKDYGGVEALSFSPDDATIQLITNNGYFAEWDLRTGTPLRNSQISGENNVHATICPGRNLAAMAINDQGTVDLLNLETGEFLVRLHNLHPDRHWFVETTDGAIDGPDDVLTLEQLVLEEMKVRHDPPAVRDTCRKAFSQVAPNQSVHGTTQPGRRLFVLAVGVSEHKYSEYNLNYAARDAEQLTQVLRKIRPEVFAEVFVQVYTNKDANRDNIQEGLAWLSRSCTPDDVAIVLFSGHGIRGRNGLYFVPHEGDAQGIQSTCMNWTTIAESIARTNASQILFLADCCHAGAFSKESRPTQDDIAGSLQKKNGLLLFCSSQSEELSLELASQRHGAFTGAILEALNGIADTNGDQLVVSEELVQYVSKRVRELTEGKQSPYLPYPDQYDRQTVVSGIVQKK